MVGGWLGPMLFRKSSTVAAGAFSADVTSIPLNGVLAEETSVDWGEGVRGAGVCGCFPFRDAMTALRASSSRRRCCSMSSRLGLPETCIVGAIDAGIEGISVALSVCPIGCSCTGNTELVALDCPTGS